MFDVFMLSLEQKFTIKKRISGRLITAKVLNRRGKKRHKYYDQYFPTMNNLSGIMYKLFADTEMGQFECGDDIFNVDFENSIPVFEVGYPEYFFGDNNGSVHYSLSLCDEYRAPFCSLIESFLKKSPIHTVAFLCFGGNSNGQEIVIGTLPKAKFYELFAQEKVYTDICYLITADAD
jgi:hypothetical protein